MRDKLITVCGHPIRVDEEDIPRIKGQKWSAAPVHGVIKFYTRVRIDGKLRRITMQRFLLNPPPGLYAVRLNHETPFDFRKKSFRIDSMSGRQACNRKLKARETTSKYKGVYFSTRDKKWIASIHPLSETITLGRFDCEDEAALAYNKAAKQYFGETSFQNEVDGPTRNRRPKR